MEETFLKEEEDISHAFIYYPADESHGGRFFPMETLIAGGGAYKSPRHSVIYSDMMISADMGKHTRRCFSFRASSTAILYCHNLI
jgi:hypothetical protein